MYGILQLVESAEQYAREVEQDRQRCQVMYETPLGSCDSYRCTRRTSFRCSECQLALCSKCVEVVAFEPYCQSCAEVERAFIAALVRELGRAQC